MRLEVAMADTQNRKSPDIQITVTVPPELLEELDRQAAEQERSRSSLVRLLLRDALAQRKAG